ncbi:Transcriptional regulatory protein LiaR [Nonomuraea coxensis DSM 45129]|uniref:Transcriptional regulatory protein LiaR n=1 Tax=Nonomuraea coxensis DSM 45129 TaxID=1122611 RepID=A0ABX8U7R8_9ACTN|nr:response regulator transcription factor [Nonomuraea coxensis]QYC43774.1 Transcriptional regulatory protein LiaR [Nonomuraea coxensis DSM 45129]
MSIRVLIVDDHEVVRQGLRFVLEQEDGIEVAGEAGDGEAALRAVRALRPDVVLLDLVMPGTDGLGTLRALREASDGPGGPGEPGGPDRPAPAVIVLTSFQEEDQVVEAVRLGALSYLSKTSAVDRVVEAVRAAAGGGSVLEPGIAALLVRQVGRAGRPRPLDTLTPRERDVLGALARGRSNAEIARDLRMGRETVKSHVSSILAKLGVSDRTQAAIYALQQGLVPLDEAL